jgi:hypothetical protein
MKWFDDWFEKKAREVWETVIKSRDEYTREVDMHKAYAMGQAINKVSSISHSPQAQSINFQIYPANGGHVVEVYTPEYSSLTINTSPNRSLYIIPSDKDIGNEISKIITLEMLKK